MREKKTVFQSKKKKTVRIITVSAIFLLMIIFTYIVLPEPNMFQRIFLAGMIPFTIGLLFLAIAGTVLILKNAKVVENSPEQTQQVKVIGKRISEQLKFEFEASVFDYIVAFSFPDGSEKELQVGNSVKSNADIYDSIHEGNTGTLTFKERENIESHYHVKDKHLHWNGRLFIKFEKDME